MPGKDPFYAKTPKVPKKGVADGNPVGKVPLGTLGSPVTPANPGFMKGVGGLKKLIGHPWVKGSHGYGHGVKYRAGHLRLSGHTKAHQLGKTKI